MSMEFGKLNFSVSFNPTSAFPLDARSYFESYAEAEKAAKLATAAGGAKSVYYYGQTLVVVENDKAKFYIIQPNNTLSAVEGSSGETEVPVNSDLFEKDELTSHLLRRRGGLRALHPRELLKKLDQKLPHQIDERQKTLFLDIHTNI